MPDEHSNLNPSTPRRRPVRRRSGRHSGRGRLQRPPVPISGNSPVQAIPANTNHVEPIESSAEQDIDSSGGFREPHPETSSEFASHAAEPVESPEPEQPHAVEPPPREQQQFRRQPDRRPEPVHARQWVKPADFRPADASAISQAVSHATEIAESLKQMIDLLDEMLELVEVAERQKIADEREIHELQRALRRIQPPRREIQQSSQRDPRRPMRDVREQPQNRPEPVVQHKPEMPGEKTDPSK